MLGVVLHPLQLLLVTLEAPGVVPELHRVAVAQLQRVVEHVCLLQPLHLHVLLELVAVVGITEKHLSVSHTAEFYGHEPSMFPTSSQRSHRVQ